MSIDQAQLSAISEAISGNGHTVALLQEAQKAITTGACRNLTEAISRIGTALIDIPVAKLEQISTAIRINTSNQVLLTNTAAHQIATRLVVPSEIIGLAENEFSAKALGKQFNTQKALKKCFEDLAKEKPSIALEETAEISHDWLNSYMAEAEKMSSEYMQKIFGKILAGEILKPKRFSIRTLRTLSELNQETAENFARCCSLVVEVKGKESDFLFTYLDQTDFFEWGLSKEAFADLVEFGLIRVLPEFQGIASYIDRVKKLTPEELSKEPDLKIVINKKEWGIRIQKDSAHNIKNIFSLPLGGGMLSYSLTRVGKELMSIVDTTHNQRFIDELRLTLEKNNAALIEY